VRSLGAFCDEHDLDEEAMLAVSRGETDEHEGWACEAVNEYDAPTETVTVEDVVEDDGEAEAAEAADGEAVDADAAAPPAMPPMQMNKMLLGFLAPMGATRLLKRFDQTSPQYLIGLRAFFFAVIGFNVLVQFLLGWRIGAADDTTTLPAVPANPLSMLFGGGAAKPATKTVREYDREQLKSMRSSYQFGCLFNLFLHFQMKMQQPLVYSSVSGLIDLFYNPLVQIHLLGKKPEGPYKRPFGGGGPDLSAASQ